MPIIYLTDALHKLFEGTACELFNHFRGTESPPISNILELYLRAAIMDVRELDRSYLLNVDAFLKSGQSQESAWHYYLNQYNNHKDLGTVYFRILSRYIDSDRYKTELTALTTRLVNLSVTLNEFSGHRGFMAFFCIPKANSFSLNTRPFYLCSDGGIPISEADANNQLLQQIQSGVDPGRVSARLIPQFLDPNNGDISFTLDHLPEEMKIGLKTEVQKIADEVWNVYKKDPLNISFQTHRRDFLWQTAMLMATTKIENSSKDHDLPQSKKICTQYPRCQ